jgi:hypothetical protein
VRFDHRWVYQKVATTVDYWGNYLEIASVVLREFGRVEMIVASLAEQWVALKAGC